jgi:hypothetical protein
MPKPRFTVDLLERLIATYAETYVGLWVASGLGAAYITDMSSWDKALVAFLPTAVALIKGLVAKGIGSPDSAALLPASEQRDTRV